MRNCNCNLEPDIYPGVVDIRSRRDFSSFALLPGEPPALALCPAGGAMLTFLRSGWKRGHFSSFGPARPAARRRSEDLFVRGPPGTGFSGFARPVERGPFCGGAAGRPRAGRPSVADFSGFGPDLLLAARL